MSRVHRGAMSNVTGDGGSFSSGSKSAGEDGVHKRCGHTADVSTAQLPPAKRKRNLPGTPGDNSDNKLSSL